MYDERNLPGNGSQRTRRMFSERNKMVSFQPPDPAIPSSNRELRVRASSPLLGRSYQSNQSSARYSTRPPVPMDSPRLHNPGGTAGFTLDPKYDEYSFDTRSQRSLAFGVVEDMRGIGFPQLDHNAKSAKNAKPAKPTTPKGDRQAEKVPKKKPSRLDLSLLFPKPKPVAAPLLSPQRYTNSPSPVTSEFSVKPQPAKLTKPRSRGNVRASIKEPPAPPPPAPMLQEPPFPLKRISTRKPAVDWFDVPLEQIIRLGEPLEVEMEEEQEKIEKSARPFDHSMPSNQTKPGKESRHSKAISPVVPEPSPLPMLSDKTYSPAEYKRSSRTPSRVSNHTSRGSRGNENHYYRQPPPPSTNTTRPRASLQTWQSEGDLRSANRKSAGRLLKKKSASTFHTKDLTKTSVLSLSSSEDEGTDADEDYGQPLTRKAAPSRGPRDSVSTNDYVEPEICHAEAVVATKSYGLTRLGRANSNVSSVSSDSRSTQRRPIPSRADTLSPLSRSSVSIRMYAPPHFNVPLIEEPEEQAEEASSTLRNRLSSQSHSDLHSAKRRSRIIAVTRQEESLLEAMRLRNGRITPSIFKDIEPAVETPTESQGKSGSPSLGSPEPVQTQFDTSFLRLSAAMRIPPISAPNLAENESLIDKDSYLQYRPASDHEQKADQNSTNFSASPRLSFAYSETPSSSSTMGHASPVTPTLLPSHRYSHQLAAPPPSHALPALPDENELRQHSRRRTDSSDAIVLEESETEKLSNPPAYPLWAVKWGRDPEEVALAH